MAAIPMAPAQAQRVGIQGQHTPARNPYANTMGRSAVGMHKTILPLMSGHIAPNHHPQQQQPSQQHLSIAHYQALGAAWRQAPPPVHFGRMPPAGGSYRQQTTMVIPVHQPNQSMINFDDQYHPSAGTTPMMRQPQQQAMPTMAPYHAPNLQP